MRNLDFLPQLFVNLEDVVWMQWVAIMLRGM